MIMNRITLLSNSESLECIFKRENRLKCYKKLVPGSTSGLKWQRKIEPKKNQTRIIGLQFGVRMNTLVKWIESFQTLSNG